MRSKCRFDVQNPDLGMSLFIATKRLFLSPIHSNLASKVGPVKVQFDYICMYLKCQTVNKYLAVWFVRSSGGVNQIRFKEPFMNRSKAVF
jgi:hypothetical protein